MGACAAAATTLSSLDRPALNGNFSNDLFGHVVNSAPPRLIQVALKLTL